MNLEKSCWNSSPGYNSSMFLSALLIGISYLPPCALLNGVLAWIACLYFTYIVKHKRLSPRSWFLFGLVLTATQFYWAPYIFQKYSEANYFFCILFAFVIWSLSATQFVVLGFCLRFFEQKNLALVFIWPILEVVYPKFIPWHLGNTQISFSHLAQIADLGGPALISLVMLGWSYLIVNFRLHNLSIITFSAGIIFAYSHYRIEELERLSKNANKISLGVVQPNLDSELDFTKEKLAQRMQKLMRLSGELFNHQTDLLIWPENAVGYTYEDKQTFIERNSTKDPFPALHLPLLFGAQAHGTGNAMYNSAYIMQTDGNLSSRYYKQKLFPFSETIPLSKTFPILKKLFKPATYVMETDTQEALQINNINLAIVICFEDLWTGLYRNLLKDETGQILITLANDGWFANSTAGYQHKLLASWRAIEYRRYMLRATNNGYTELISPTGAILKALPIKKEGTLYLEKVPALNKKTFYQKLIDILKF